MTTLQHSGRAVSAADPHAWSYGPGEWYAVLSRDAAVLLPPGERHRITSLWTAVDDGAGFDALLDALLAEGLRDLSGFVLLAVERAVEGAAVRVLARGEATVSCDTDEGPVLLDGRDADTWSERRLVGVRSTRVVLDDAGRGDAAGSEPADEVPEARVVGTALVRVAWVAHPAPVGSAPPITEPEPLVPDPLVPDPPVPDPPVPDPLRPDPAPPDPDPDPDPAPEPAPARARDTDHDGGTRTGGGGDPVARLILSTGEVVDVDRVVLVGRDPEARPGRDPTQEPGQQPGQPRLVRVLSPQQEISSTHLEVRPGRGADRGAAVATDLGSTNGTIVVQPGLPQEDLQPYTPVPLLPGAVLDLGDGVTLQVSAP